MTDGVIKQPTGTVGFERKVQVRDYETAVASIFIQFDVDLENEAQTASNAKDAFFTAKSVVLEQLGVEFEYDQQKGIVKELLTKTFGPVTEVAPNVNGSTQSARGLDGGPNCPKCNGGMYDNRGENDKRVAAGQKLQPDYRCKNYKANPACDGVIWRPKGGK